MNRQKLDSVTLLGADCVNVERLAQAADICTKDFEFAAVKLLTSLPSNRPEVIPIDPIQSTAEYSEFIVRHLDEYVETEHVLIIQYDGFILNPNAWKDEFLEYDYIGAPWLVRKVSVNRFGFPRHLLGRRVVGNGGFSLRSKKFIHTCAQLAKENTFDSYHPEDLQLCVHHRADLEERGLVFAPIGLAQKFSFESDGENRIWNGQFGFHGLRWTDISGWLSEHPEYDIDNTLIE